MTVPFMAVGSHRLDTDALWEKQWRVYENIGHYLNGWFLSEIYPPYYILSNNKNVSYDQFFSALPSNKAS